METKAVCKAFGNEERARLVACLAREQSVGELLDRCSLAQSALSQHLRVLRDAGAIVARREGKYVLYRARTEAVRLAKLLLAYPHR